MRVSLYRLYPPCSVQFTSRNLNIAFLEMILIEHYISDCLIIMIIHVPSHNPSTVPITHAPNHFFTPIHMNYVCVGATSLLAGSDLDRRIQADDCDRWNRHRNEPWWVVGEQRHLPPPPPPPSPLGETTTEILSPLFTLGDVTPLVVLSEAMCEWNPDEISFPGGTRKQKNETTPHQYM